MACYHPLVAYRCADGAVVFSELKGDVVKTLSLPCGQCIGCRLERSRQWAVRCVHEISLSERNCFVTLTYSDVHLPANGSLDYRDFQLFLKRLRKRFVGCRIRFYMCGEYGEELGRPHFHSLLFGVDFPDMQFLRKTSTGYNLYRSQCLEELWPFGHSSIGAANFETAAYVARYVMKKVTGDKALAHYAVVDSDGVVSDKVPEFNRMSLKPGIGAGWLEKFRGDVYPHGKVVSNGVESNPPRYYDKLFEKVDAVASEELAMGRESAARRQFHDNSDERLAVKEQVKAAQLRMLRRSM